MSDKHDDKHKDDKPKEEGKHDDKHKDEKKDKKDKKEKKDKGEKKDKKIGALNAKKFTVTVSFVPPVPAEEVAKFTADHINDSYVDSHAFPDQAKALIDKRVELQYKRWEWAQGNQWKYINALRIAGFPDVAIQSMCDGLRPLCFTTPEIHQEFCTSLSHLGKKLEEELGLKNVRFVQTGSSVVGFSTNPLKGVADRPTKLTSTKKSDVDVVILADNLMDFINKSTESKKPFIGKKYPTTRSQTTTGNRVSCSEPKEVCPGLKEWYDIWFVKLAGGIQITLDTEANPTIPPWESWIPI